MLFKVEFEKVEKEEFVMFKMEVLFVKMEFVEEKLVVKKDVLEFKEEVKVFEKEEFKIEVFKFEVILVVKGDVLFIFDKVDDVLEQVLEQEQVVSLDEKFKLIVVEVLIGGKEVGFFDKVIEIGDVVVLQFMGVVKVEVLEF